MAKEMSQGNTYRCTKESCGVEIRVTRACQCDEECHLTCCGEKMQLL